MRKVSFLRILAFLAIVAFGGLIGIKMGWLPNPWARVVQRRLAPAGTVYAITYFSLPIAGGVIGIEPGQKLLVVEDLGTSLVIYDGKYRGEAQVQDVTNDLDIAELAARRDADSQAQLQQSLAVYRAEAERYQGGLMESDASSRRELDDRRAAAGAVGGRDRLQLSEEDQRRNAETRARWEGHLRPRLYYVQTRTNVATRATSAKPLATPSTGGPGFGPRIPPPPKSPVPASR